MRAKGKEIIDDKISQLHELKKSEKFKERDETNVINYFYLFSLLHLIKN